MADMVGGSADPGGPAGASASPVAAARPTADGGGAASNSALNEMLSAANAANDPSASRGRSDAEAAGPGGAAGGPPGGMPGAPGGNDMASMMAMMGGQGAAMQGAGDDMDPRMAGMMGGPGGPPGGMGPGDFGGLEGGFGGGQGFDQFPGAGGGSGEPADFSSPRGAVDAFLDAVKAKDILLLSEATALRAPREAETPARRKTFQAIREMSLTDEELDSVAESFEGYMVAQMSQPGSTGLVSFVLQKPGDYGSTLQRKITVRKERSGWKVNDVSGISERKQLGGRAMQQRQNRNQNTGGAGAGGRP